MCTISNRMQMKMRNDFGYIVYRYHVHAKHLCVQIDVERFHFVGHILQFQFVIYLKYAEE